MTSIKETPKSRGRPQKKGFKGKPRKIDFNVPDIDVSASHQNSINTIQYNIYNKCWGELLNVSEKGVPGAILI